MILLVVVVGAALVFAQQINVEDQKNTNAFYDAIGCPPTLCPRLTNSTQCVRTDELACLNGRVTEM
jgi:hypothetical protein